jgi:hypothetical protein
MPSSSGPSLLQDLHNFFLYSERLLAKVKECDHSFTQDEMRKICYLANQVANLADYRKMDGKVLMASGFHSRCHVD